MSSSLIKVVAASSRSLPLIAARHGLLTDWRCGLRALQRRYDASRIDHLRAVDHRDGRTRPLASTSVTPDWVAAVGQVAGAFFTFLAVVVALSSGHKAQKLRDQDRRERDSAQTRLITFEVVKAADHPSPPGEKLWSPDTRLVIITNDSSEPIRRATVSDVIADGEPQDGRQRWGFLQEPEKETPRRLISPRTSAEFRIVYFDREGEVTWPEGKTIVSIQWHDPRGLMWSLNTHGRIAQIIQSADQIARMPPWWRQRWWDPYRDRPYMSWRQRQRFLWPYRWRKFKDWVRCME
jgi:hypothetical protein